MSETLILNGKDLTLEDLYSVVYDRRPVQIDPCLLYTSDAADD